MSLLPQFVEDLLTLRSLRRDARFRPSDLELQSEQVLLELKGQRSHILEVLFVALILLVSAFVAHKYFEWTFDDAFSSLEKAASRSPPAQGSPDDVARHHQHNIEVMKDLRHEAEARLALAREVLSGVLAVLVTVFIVILRRLAFVTRAQGTVLSYTVELARRFNDIQSRDNIIVPVGMDYRVLSVASVTKLPDPIREVWCRSFQVPDCKPDDPATMTGIYGCSMLFWPSIDDVVNSPEYIRYFGATEGMDFRRILVTPKPRHMDGIRVYLELARQFGASTYIIDQDRWVKDVSRLFLKAPRLNEKREVLKLLASQIEIVSERPISDFDPWDGGRWLVRYLRSVPSEDGRDQRARLAQSGSGIATYTSKDAPDEEMYKKLKSVAAFMTAVTTWGAYRDASGDGEIEPLFAVAVPDNVQKSIEEIGL